MCWKSSANISNKPYGVKSFPWLLTLGIITGTLVVGLGIWFSKSIFDEIHSMNWPSDDASVVEAVRVDLTNLGLSITKVDDTKEEVGEGLYLEVANIEYNHNGEMAAAIMTRKYP